MAISPLRGVRVSAVLACLVGLMSWAGPAGANDAASPATDSRAGFVDVTEAVGLSYPIEFPGDGEDAGKLSEGGREGGGLALADIDGDGWPELYVAHGAGETGRLFSWNGRRFVRSAGNGGIAPAAMDRAGYFIDLDDDGLPDFLSIHAEGVQAFRNDGSGRFTETPAPFGSGRDRSVYSMAVGDYDGDGDLDPFLAHWNLPWNGIRPPARYLWRNDGKGRYEDVSHIVPVRPGALRDSGDRREFSFTPTFADIDGDGDPDILLAGDFGASQVLRNEAGSAFTDITGDAITDENGMGAAVGDYDQDGDMDWFVTSIRDAEGNSGYGPTGNRLYRNRGDGLFEDATAAAGVREGGWGWGTCLADFDNDGRRDLFLTNGWFGTYVEDGNGEDGNGEEREITAFLEDPSRLFMANGDGTFTERSEELGIRHTGQGRGVVCADYDGDGRVDILIANHGAAPTVYRNVFERRHHWLAIDLAGRHANPDAVGARVTVANGLGPPGAGGAARHRLPLPGAGDAALRAGRGPGRAVPSRCAGPAPGNGVTRLGTIAADRRITVYQAEPEGHLLRVARGGTGAGPLRCGRGRHDPRRAGARPLSLQPLERRGRRACSPMRARRSRPSPCRPGLRACSPTTCPARRGRRSPWRDAGWRCCYRRSATISRAPPSIAPQPLPSLGPRCMTPGPRGRTRQALTISARAPPPCPAAAPAGGRRPWARAGRGHQPRRLAPRPPPFSAVAGRGLVAAQRRHADGRARLRYGHWRGSRAGGGARRLHRRVLHRARSRGRIERGRRLRERRLSPSQRGAGACQTGQSRPRRPPTAGNPLDLQLFVGQSGILADDIPEFVTPEWGLVTPFALTGDDLAVHRRDEADWLVYHDPRPAADAARPARRALQVGLRAGRPLVGRALSPDDGVLIDIAPSGIGNIGAPAPLHRRLPRLLRRQPARTGPCRQPPPPANPYEPQIVPLGDYTRVLAEFWADGPDSETPPGHWFVILNAVSDHPALVRRMGGAGAGARPPSNGT